jgi:hypothetical protein
MDEELENQNDPFADAVVVEEEEDPFADAEVVGLDPELSALLRRNPQIQLTGDTITDSRVPLGGSSRLGRDVTPQMEAVADQSNRDYEYYYGQAPDGPGFGTRLGATVADVADAVIPGEQEPNQAQLDRDAARAAQEDFQIRMRAIYDEAPTAADYDIDNPEFTGGDDVRVDVRLETDEDGNVVPRYNRIPAPDSTAFTRIVNQVGSNIFQQTGGLLTEGALLEESELERRVPDFEMDGGEALATDLLSIGLPALGAERLGRGAGAALRLGRLGQAGSRSSQMFTVLGGSIGASLAETVMSTEGQEGLVFGPETIQEVFKVEDPQNAADLAMFVDGLVLNGAFDSVLYVAGRVGGFLAERGRGARGFFDPNFVRDRTQRQAMLGVLTVIDPELAGLPPTRLASSLRNLAVVMDANAETLVRIGGTTEQVALDSVNALSRGAEEYIKASRATLRREMTDDKWQDYVTREARDMTERMIGLARSQEGNSVLRTAQAGMSDSIDRAISTEAGRLLAPTDAVDNPLAEGASNLVGQRAADVAGARQASEGAEASVDAITRLRGTAVANDPLVRSLLSSDDPLRFFNDSAQVERLRGLLGDELFQQYRTAWQSVNDAYAAIPNVEIDTEMFIGDVNRVVRDANLLDASGGQTKRILGEIYRAVQPQAVEDAAGDLVFETADELLARLDGQIGFQDLYRVRQRLSNMIGETSDPAVRTRLTELKNSITDPNSGQLSFVLNSGDEAAADAALAADALYTRTMTRFQNTAPTRQFSDLARERNAGVNTATPDGFTARGQADLDAGTVNQILPTVTADRTGSQYTALREAFDDPALAATLDDAVAGLYIAEGTRALANALRGNTNQTPDLIISSFREQARMLRQTGNPVYQQLEEAAARIERLQADLGDDLLVAEEAARLAGQQLEQAENTIVGRLVNRYDPSRPTANVQQTVDSILGENDAGDAVTALMSEIRRLPDGEREITERAFQGAVLRSLRSRVFGATPIGMATSTQAAVDTRIGALASITDEVRSSVLSGVRSAFPDDPDIVTGIEEALSGLASTTTPARLRIARSGSDTAANLGVREAVSTTILFSLGYMNPSAAAARRLTAEQVNRIETAAAQTSKDTIAMVLAAPREFAELTRMISRRENPGALRTARDIFLAAAVDGLRYQLRVEPNELAVNVGEALNEALGRVSEQDETPEGFDQ